MAIVLNPCTAKSKGEQRLSRVLESFETQDLILFFSIDFIPGAREIDLLLVHKKVGVFIIEVKAVSLPAIKSVSPNRWQIDGRDSDESPLRQAYSQFEGLRDYWQRTNLKLPKISVTACLPEITRYDWEDVFQSSAYAKEISKGMLFREDLANADALMKRLKLCFEHPPLRMGFKAVYPVPSLEKFINEFKKLLAQSIPETPTSLDRQRLQALENNIKKQLYGEFPPGGRTFASFYGSPWTGKTFRLLSVGVMHAYSSKRVLFVCFNKTLASDVRRFLYFNERLSLARYALDVLDVFELTRQAFELLKMGFVDAQDHDEWGSLVIDAIKDHVGERLIHEYDTVLIDEAHDMKDWQLELVKLHSAQQSTICIAMGKGQELYRDDSSAISWLEAVSPSGNILKKQLRRNFRNTQSQYFAALAFHKGWPNHFVEIDKVHASVFAKNQSNTELGFERQGTPITYITIPALSSEFDNDGARQAELLVDEYLNILQEEINAIDSDPNAHPVALLILVPSEEGLHVEWVRAALKLAIGERDDISFIDYTQDHMRRTEPLISEIRLCTFHSARGLEGERVVIFGLEQLASFADKINCKAENLDFVALSRGIFRTTVVVRNYFPIETNHLLDKIMSYC